MTSKTDDRFTRRQPFSGGKGTIVASLGGRLLTAWRGHRATSRAQRDRAAFLSLSDHTLRDMGVQRHDFYRPANDDGRGGRANHGGRR